MHTENSKIKLGVDQLHLTQVPNPGKQSTSSTLPTISLYSVEDAATKAELIWAMKNVVSNMSALSCDGLSEIFLAMFPDAIPKGFSLGHTKLAYLVTDALGPHFRRLIIEEACKPYYTLMFDETTNSEGKKELQITTRFLSDTQQQIETHHLETFFISYATGEILADFLEKALDNAGISKNKILMLSSDGPIVNKKVFRIINEDVKSDRGTGLVNIGTCNIHVVHNAFLKGLEELGVDISDLVINVYYYFNGWPTRWEDYSTMQREEGVPQHNFIKHVSSRWLTLHPAASRLLEQRTVLVKYFLVYVPKSRAKLVGTTKYLKIANALKKSTAKAEVQFVVNSGDIFQKFTGFFQKHEPLIHVLHDKLNFLLLTLLGRACKMDVEIDLVDDIFQEKNLLPLEMVDVGEDVSKCISNLSNKEKGLFRLRAQKHYIASAKHITSKISLANDMDINLKHFRCLQPSEISKERSCKSILKIAKLLPLKVTDSTLSDEWKLLRLEDLKSEDKERIDHFWRQVFYMKNAFNEPKYPIITKVVKASLTLSHGSADVERAFSVSSQVLSDDKTAMSVRTLNARLYIKDGLKRYNNRPELVPISKELLISAKSAHKNYQNHLAEVKRKALENELQKKEAREKERQEKEIQDELEKSKQCINKLENDLKTAKKVHCNQKEAADKMFSEANNRLKIAIRKSDLNEIQLAHAMFQGAESLRKEERIKESKADNLQKQLGKRQSSLITNFFKKPRKDV